MKNLYKIQNQLYIIDNNEKVTQNGIWAKCSFTGDILKNRNGQYAYKVILTTNDLLIKDGVQAIDDEFLEWIVKNPSCQYGGYKDIDWGKIITSKEEPKQEKLEKTTEINLTRLCYYDKRNPDFQIKEEYGYDKEEVEATGNFSKKDCACDNCFYGRSKLTEQLIWQQDKNKYSEEDLRNAYRWGTTVNHGTKEHFNEWFEQFKKK